LVSTGHDPVQAVVVLLLMNTFATVWGAVGTPIWFGLGTVSLNLTEQELLEVSFKAFIALGISAFLLLPMILTVIVPIEVVKQNILFILLSLATSIGPLMILAPFNYEFPSLLAGILGCAGTAILIKAKVGLRPIDPQHMASMLGRDIQDIGSVAENSVVRSYQRSLSGTTVSIPEATANNKSARNYHKAISDITTGPTTIEQAQQHSPNSEQNEETTDRTANTDNPGPTSSPNQSPSYKSVTSASSLCVGTVPNQEDTDDSAPTTSATDMVPTDDTTKDNGTNGIVHLESNNNSNMDKLEHNHNDTHNETANNNNLTSSFSSAHKRRTSSVRFV
jgi:hypothetical protein